MTGRVRGRSGSGATVVVSIIVIISFLPVLSAGAWCIAINYPTNLLPGLTNRFYLTCRVHNISGPSAGARGPSGTTPPLTLGGHTGRGAPGAASSIADLLHHPRYPSGIPGKMERAF